MLVSCGAKHSLYNVAEALLEAGDEIIIPTPYWVSYADQALLNDATPILLPTSERDGYAIHAEALQERVTPRTKAIIVNSPCNPTGATYDRKTLEAIATIALRHKILIISDEIYEKVLYDDARHISIATLSPEVAAQTVVINGVSKAYAMTGWRIGYAAGPKDLLTAMANIQSQSTSNPCSISQKAAVAALKLGGPFTENMVVEFDRRRKVMIEHLNRIPGVRAGCRAGPFMRFPISGACWVGAGPMVSFKRPTSWRSTCCMTRMSRWCRASRSEASNTSGSPMPRAWPRSHEGSTASRRQWKSCSS